MLDIFFEVLNYETIEQKKAYEIAGLLGEPSLVPGTYIPLLPSAACSSPVLAPGAFPSAPVLHEVKERNWAFSQDKVGKTGVREGVEGQEAETVSHILENGPDTKKAVCFVKDSFFLNSSCSFWESRKMQKSIENKNPARGWFSDPCFGAPISANMAGLTHCC